jgi:hypothetical protein
VNSNQILSHKFSCNGFLAGRLPAFTMSTNGPTGIRPIVQKKFPAAAAPAYRLAAFPDDL